MQDITKGINMEDIYEYLEELKIKCKDLDIAMQRELINELIEDMNTEDYHLTLADNYGLSELLYYATEEDPDYCLDYITRNGRGISSHEIARLITFDNCNAIAMQLAIEDEETAIGLYNELEYWKDKRKF
jgi:hypothetical protein